MSSSFEHFGYRYRRSCTLTGFLLLLVITVTAGQDRLPTNYVDDIFHCNSPWDAEDDQDESIGCDFNTWEWNVEEFKPEGPPEICEEAGDIDLIIVEAVVVADRFEPCVLWAMTYGSSELTTSPSDPATDAAPIPDDLYHCRDPTNVDRVESITCDLETFLWNVEELTEGSPPRMCGRSFTMDREEIPNVQDWFEPCVLWALIYGNLQPTPSPTLSPTSPTVVPVYNVTTAPTIDGIDPSNEPPVGEPDTAPVNRVQLMPLLMTLVFDEPVLQASSFSLDRFELQDLTERHILETLQTAIGVGTIADVSLLLTSGVPKSTTLTETITGEVAFAEDTNIPDSTMQALLLQAFQGDALELMVFRLQKLARDPTLNQVQSVIVSTTMDYSVPNSDQATVESDDGSMDTIWIAVFASGGAVLAALCLFGYCMFCRPGRRPSKQKGKKVNRSNKNKGNKNNRSVMGSVVSASYSRSQAAREIMYEIPPLPTKSSSMEDYLIEDDEDEENPASMSNFTMSELDDQSVASSVQDQQSIGTSVYSYCNDESSLMGASALYSVHETGDDTSFETDASFDNVGAKKKKRKKKSGLLWSVMDTLQTHFGNGESEEEEEDEDLDLISPMTANTAFANMLGPSTTEESDNESANSNSLLYDGDTSRDSSNVVDALVAVTASTSNILDNAKGDDNTTEQDDGLNTPVKERLERLWKEDDEHEDIQQTTTPESQVTDGAAIAEDDDLQVTVKKNNLASARGAGAKVFDGEESGNTGPELEEESLRATEVVLEASKLESAPPLPSIDDAAAVSSPEAIIKTEDGDNMSVPLPSQLDTSLARGSSADAAGATDNSSESDVASQTSESDHSTSNSSGRRRLFGGAAASSDKVRSARNKRGGSNGWSSNSSTHSAASTSDNKSVTSESNQSVASSKTTMSTDSAMYRSLLNQGDTNDAALFGLLEDTTLADTSNDDSLNATPTASFGTITDATSSAAKQEPAKEPSGELEADTPTGLSSLIQSFDNVWVKDAAARTEEAKEPTNLEEEPKLAAVATAAKSSSKSTVKSTMPTLTARKPSVIAPIDIDSDEDVYVEDDEDDDHIDAVHSISIQHSQQEATLSAVPVMGSLLSTTETEDEDISHDISEDPEDCTSFDGDISDDLEDCTSFDGVEQRIPFEHEDLKEDMVFPDEEKKEDDVNLPKGDEKMEHPRKVSSKEIAATMASF